ncbi:MAG: prolipoprotein diacylglyceryl transferase [Saprospiraceae bacterium]|nr:prolipoprotein diacylglyceryl transferase [Saprospiraceae bacterium]
MYPDLSYFFHDVFGTPYDNWTSIFKTFGLLMAIAFLVSAWILRLELIRKEKEGFLKPTVLLYGNENKNLYTSAIINGIVGFILGFKIPLIFSELDRFKQDPAGTLFSTDGNILIALIVAVGFGAYSYWDSKKNAGKTEKEITLHPYERTGDIIIIAAISGIIGARLFSILENFDLFLTDPVGQIFSGSGLTMYGGLIVAFAAVYYYVRKKGIPPLHMMDMAGLAIVVGYGIGRLGCHFSGDGDWGIVNEMTKPGWFILPDWMWSYNYPHNVINEGIPLENCSAHYCKQLVPGVFPTSVYEFIAMLIVFTVMWKIRKRIKIAGVLFFIFLIFQGIERFLIETIRVNPKYIFLGMNLSQAQYISLAIIIAGIIGIFYLYKRHKKIQIDE